MTKPMMHKSLLAAAMLSIVSIGTLVTSGAVHGAEQSAPAFETITSAQLAERLRAKDFAFVNVHIPYEGEIAQTDAFIPFDEIGRHLDLLPSDKSAEIVLYCRSGRMSEIAANELSEFGYTNDSHLAGGMVDWARTGHDLLQRD